MKLSKEKILEACMALILLCLVSFILTQMNFLLIIAVCILLISMTSPMLMRLPSVMWYKLALVLGVISNIAISSFVFYLVLLPISLFRKVTRSHTDLKVKDWSKNKESAFISRNHKYTKSDMENMF